MFSFCILTLCQFKKRLEKRKSTTEVRNGRKSQLSLPNTLATTFFSLKWSFTKVLVKKQIEIGALVSGSEMSKFGSWNVTKYCAHGRYLPNKNEMYALLSWWDMSNFVGSWNLTKHCVNCFLALVSVGKISFPALVSGGWSRFDVKMSQKKLTQGQNIQKEIPAVSVCSTL